MLSSWVPGAGPCQVWGVGVRDVYRRGSYGGVEGGGGVERRR